GAPRDVARNLRNTIGLTTEQAGWVRNFQGRQVADLVAQGFTPQQALARSQAATTRYHNRIHRYRTESIARTEILSASHEGRRQAWGQGLSQGFISPNAMQEWSAEVDNRVCQICESYDQMRVPVGSMFPDGDPPIHPMCRCDVLLIDDPGAPQALPELPDAQLDNVIEDLAQQTVTSVDFDKMILNAPGFARRGRIAEERIRAAGDNPGDRILSEMYKYTGYDARPRIVTSAEFDELEARGARVVYRGIMGDNAPDYLDEFRYGDYYPGVGVSGNGTYTSYNPKDALFYGDDIQSHTIRMAIDDRAVVVEFADLMDEWREFRMSSAWSRIAEDGKEAFEDPGRYAVARGYDAINVSDKSSNRYLVLLNRGKAIMDDQNGVGE
ncbi:MAG TPA: phage minor head protein, partial [Acidimicrobiia bacterium]